jgi:hypothetical protein
MLDRPSQGGERNRLVFRADVGDLFQEARG